MFANTRRITRRASRLFTLVLAVSSFATTSIAASSDAPAPQTSGHCAFNLKNQWAGPYKACIDPSTPAQCAETGRRDDNSDAQFAAGACPTPNRIGTCARADASVHYYDGDAGSLEVGCGFQGGTWKSGS